MYETSLRIADRGNSRPPLLSEVGDVLGHVLALRSSAGLLVDFDGTLAPIVMRPELAQCSPAVQEALASLATRYQAVAVVSGRDLNDLAQRVQVPGVWLVGSHGAVIRPPRGPDARLAVADEHVQRLQAMAIDLTDLEGVRTEQKGTAVAFHYRGLEHDGRLVGELRARVRAAAQATGLVVGEGRCVLEARVPGIDKGAALNYVVGEAALDTAVVVGDDWTDLDAFRAAHRHPTCRGTAVAVSSPEIPSPLRAEADVLASDVDEVGKWLVSLAAKF